MRLLSLLFAAALLIGCASSEDASDAEQAMTNGTVRYVGLEGGFYGIEGEDGAKYNSASLPEAFREDGLAVRFRYRERSGDVMTTQMWGASVEILEIERR